MSTTLYDSIGQTYDTTRRADPWITRRLAALLDVQPEHQCLDIGCGSGNYTIALAALAGTWYGIDQSADMLGRAQAKSTVVHWHVADAAALPFQDAAFHRVLCTLAIHHFPDMAAAFSEVQRVLAANGRFVVFTSLAEQMEHYWLKKYFPEIMRRSIEQMPSMEKLSNALHQAGLAITATELYNVRPDLKDLFLYSGKFNPAVYLNPLVRAGISSFAALANQKEVDEGCMRLEADMDSGRVYDIIEDSAHKGGDYMFVVVEHQ